jgi:RNA polymerase sigma-70 factor (ECF subfamily)
VEGRPPDDADLTRRAKEGDMDAYAQLVRAYQPVAVRVAHLICGGSADAEDAAQEGFVKAYRALDRYRDGAPFRPWLLSIVANEAKNRRRSAGRRAGYELALVEDRALGEAAPSPEAAVLVRESQGTLLAALARLPTRQRDVVSCRYLLGLSEAETASTLGLPAGTVKSRLARAIARLREELPSDA